MEQSAIRAALETRLATWATAQGYPVAWENVAVKKPRGLWLRATLLPGAPSMAALACDAHKLAGVFQVDVIAPEGEGAKRAETAVEAIVALFGCGGLSGGLIVQGRPAIGAAFRIGGDYVVPVSINYAT